MAQADGAAPAVGGIAIDLCAAGNVDGTPAHQNGAAVQTGGVAGDFRTAGNVDRAIAAHVNSAAAGIVAALGRFIAGDGAAGHIDGAAGSGEKRAAILGRVVPDNAAVHIKIAAGSVRLVCGEVLENSAAVVPAVVAGNFAAVHVEYTLDIIQRNGSAAATFGDFAAGELAAEHIQGAFVEVDAGAAPNVFRRSLEGSAALTVAEDKPSAVFDLNFSGTVAGEGLSVQAQVKRFAIHRQMSAERGVVRQVNIGGIVGIWNAARTVPRRIDRIGMTGMVARCDVAAAIAMGVVSLQREISTRFAE